jgi:glycosyltransferase involved in cell wall biosynthesis
MKILIYVNTKQNFHNTNNLGGIEILNFDLYNYLKKHYKTLLTNSLTTKIKKTKWDIVISSNDSIVFDSVNTKRKILWLHNKLQIEKAFRKKQLFSILFNNIEAVFVSNYLNYKTSKLYGFKKRIVIPNFLPKIFENYKNTKKSYLTKKKIVWSVQREKGLDKVIEIWINKINVMAPQAELHIFVENKINVNKLIKKNIFFHGKIPRNKLLDFYKNSIGMICLGYDETFCLNAIEAMKMGLPVISLGETALNELIINKKNGYKINNIENIYKPILNLIDLNSNQRNKISKSSIKFTKKFNSKYVFNKWNNLILS